MILGGLGLTLAIALVNESLAGKIFFFPCRIPIIQIIPQSGYFARQTIN
jgi:hypothetical protein